MKYLLFLIFSLAALLVKGQDLPSRWDELTASDWPAALRLSDSTCILPIGVLEKHGPHAPMGTDVIRVREYAARAIRKEYAVVFPDYFYGQINEARHQPGCIALAPDLLLKLLEATCDEIARNGFKKILIVNGHGGNPQFLQFFMQSTLGKRRNYAVYLFQQTEPDTAYFKQMTKLNPEAGTGGDHAGVIETSEILYFRPELVKPGRAKDESGRSQNRLVLPNLYTPIWWYADYPNHYDGDGSQATMQIGKLSATHVVNNLIKALQAVKQDRQTLKLQQEFFDRVKE